MGTGILEGLIEAGCIFEVEDSGFLLRRGELIAHTVNVRRLFLFLTCCAFRGLGILLVDFLEMTERALGASTEPCEDIVNNHQGIFDRKMCSVQCEELVLWVLGLGRAEVLGGYQLIL